MKNSKKKVKKAIKKMTLQDLQSASRDPEVQYRMRQKNSMRPIITSSDRMLVRKFARMNLPLAQQRSSKITFEIFEKQLLLTLKKVKPEFRAMVMDQMRDYVEQGK